MLPLAIQLALIFTLRPVQVTSSAHGQHEHAHLWGGISLRSRREVLPAQYAEEQQLNIGSQKYLGAFAVFSADYNVMVTPFRKCDYRGCYGVLVYNTSLSGEYTQLQLLEPGITAKTAAFCGNIVAFGGGDGDVVIYNATTPGNYREMQRINGCGGSSPKEVTAIAFTPECDLLAYARDLSATVLTRDAAGEFRKSTELRDHARFQTVTSVAITPDGRTMATGAYGELFIRDITRPEEIKTKQRIKGGSIDSGIEQLLYSPNGNALVVCFKEYTDYRSQTIVFNSTVPGEYTEIQQLKYAEGGAYGISFTASGNVLAAVYGEDWPDWEDKSNGIKCADDYGGACSTKGCRCSAVILYDATKPGAFKEIQQFRPTSGRDGNAETTAFSLTSNTLAILSTGYDGDAKLFVYSPLICSKGQFLISNNGTCGSCPSNTFQSDTSHSETVCYTTTSTTTTTVLCNGVADPDECNNPIYDGKCYGYIDSIDLQEKCPAMCSSCTSTSTTTATTPIPSATITTTTLTQLTETTAVTTSKPTASIMTTVTTTTTLTQITETPSPPLDNAEKVDCVEKQDDCTAACEVAVERNYKEVVPATKVGVPCIGAVDCQPGEGECSTKSSTTTSTMAIPIDVASTTEKRKMSTGAITAIAIGILVLFVGGFAWLYIWVPKWLSKRAGAYGHLELNDQNVIAIADMFPDQHTTLAGMTILESSSDGDVPLPKSGCAAVRLSRSSKKFVAPAIRLGRAVEAAHGLADLMGYDNMSIIQHIMVSGGGVDAIENEIELHGTAEDKANLHGLLTGTYVCPDGTSSEPPSAEELAARRKTIDELMQTDQVKTARLTRAHVVALRLYTTSTYASINQPLRTSPPTKPHPFAITTYFVSEGIKLLRSVAAELPGAHQPQDFWRGMKDLTISDEFLESGGTEFACMSTSLSQETAIDFAESRAPMILKLETKDFMSRGADISFLSVYPGESETLFPPLTFLRPISKERLVRNERTYLLVRCEPVIP